MRLLVPVGVRRWDRTARGREGGDRRDQVFAVSASPQGHVAAPMESGQRVSAECQRYLHEMGVDPQVWVHAMETPKERLYFFKRDELLALKLAT